MTQKVLRLRFRNCLRGPIVKDTDAAICENSLWQSSMYWHHPNQERSRLGLGCLETSASKSEA